MDVQIAPKAEVISLETVAGKCFPLARWIVERSPKTHFAVAVNVCVHDVISLFLADTLFRLNARDEEFVVDT